MRLVKKDGKYLFSNDGTAVKFPEPALQEKTIEPTTEAQIITPDTDYDGLTRVNLSAVTSSIDSNIASSNIKNGVEILGVTGTFTGGTNLIKGTTTTADSKTIIISEIPSAPTNIVLRTNGYAPYIGSMCYVVYSNPVAPVQIDETARTGVVRYAKVKANTYAMEDIANITAMFSNGVLTITITDGGTFRTDVPYFYRITY